MWFFNTLQEDITFGAMITSSIILAIMLGYKQSKILMPFGMVLLSIIPALFSGYQMSCFVDGDCAYLAWFYTVMIFISSIVYIYAGYTAAEFVKTHPVAEPSTEPAQPVPQPAVPTVQTTSQPTTSQP